MANGGTSVAGSFIQTLTTVDVATGWTECVPPVNRDGSLVVTRRQSPPPSTHLPLVGGRTCRVRRKAAGARRS